MRSNLHVFVVFVIFFFIIVRSHGYARARVLCGRVLSLLLCSVHLLQCLLRAGARNGCVRVCLSRCGLYWLQMKRDRERDRGLRKMFIDAILMDYVKCLGH